MKVKLKDVRLAFPALFEAKTVGGQGEPAFSASFILPPDHPSIKDVNDALEAVAKEKWGAKGLDQLKALRASGKVCLHNGDEKSNYDGFEGNLYISARAKSRPYVADRANNPTTASDGLIYGGCYVYASIELWAQDNNYGKRINATLKGVQFFRDGDAFSGSSPASPDDFEDLTQGVDENELA